jgi:DNA-binding XRE family transcriptional regulator
MEINSRLKLHRKHAGLSQEEVANLIGYLNHQQVSRHERDVELPMLLIALGYQAIFRVPVSELFPGVYEMVKLGVDQRLKTLANELHQSTVKGRQIALIAHKLEWVCERDSK